MELVGYIELDDLHGDIYLNGDQMILKVNDEEINVEDYSDAVMILGMIKENNNEEEL